MVEVNSAEMILAFLLQNSRGERKNSVKLQIHTLDFSKLISLYFSPAAARAEPPAEKLSESQQGFSFMAHTDFAYLVT